MSNNYKNGEEKGTFFELHQNNVLVIPQGVQPNQIVIIRPEDKPSDSIVAGLAKPT